MIYGHRVSFSSHPGLKVDAAEDADRLQHHMFAILEKPILECCSNTWRAVRRWVRGAWACFKKSVLTEESGRRRA
eukprot:4618258-Pleurochrysis_carterae.AAC.3